MRYEVCDMNCYITWPYQIADHYCRIMRDSTEIWLFDVPTQYLEEEASK